MFGNNSGDVLALTTAWDDADAGFGDRSAGKTGQINGNGSIINKGVISCDVAGGTLASTPSLSTMREPFQRM